MKVFLLKTILVSVGLFLVLYILDWSITHGHRDERFAQIKNRDNDYKIIIVGTSRAFRHFNSDIISEKTRKRTLNIGYDASGLETQIALLNYYLVHNPPPEILIWEINYNTLSKDTTVYLYEELIPLIRDTTIRVFLKENKIINNADIYLPYYRYTNLKNLTKVGIYNTLFGKIDSKKDFRIQDKPWDKSAFEASYLNSEYKILKDISGKRLNRLLNELKILKEKKIDVIFVFTPIYAGMSQKQDDKEKIILYYDSLFTQLKLPFLNYINTKISRDTLNFYNALHMNKVGVDKFMPIFASDLNEIIANK